MKAWLAQISKEILTRHDAHIIAYKLYVVRQKT